MLGCNQCFFCITGIWVSHTVLNTLNALLTSQKVLVARPDDDPNLVIGRPELQEGNSRPQVIPGGGFNPSSIQVGQSIKFAPGDESGPPPTRIVKPSKVSVVSGQQTIFFSNNKPQQSSNELTESKFKEERDRFVDEDPAHGGNLLGSANTQQPATVPAPVLPAELPPAPTKRPVNPLFKDRQPPAIQLPRIVPQQPGQPQRPFQSPQVRESF
jgi:hypothetical protein